MTLIIDGTKGIGFVSPLNGAGGRLSLASGTPVMTTSVPAANAVYYCPYIGRFIPLFDGSIYTMRDFGGELSQLLADASKSPAAAAPEACYDIFVWDDAGVMRISRGPFWVKSSTVTISIATPAVITWNGHGLREGAPVIFTNSGGALPTGITAGTIYYVVRNPTANTFNIATSVVNSASLSTYVATSGTQSGTHTATNRDTIRGSGSGTSELTRISGLYLNAQSIAGGPAAQRGTYVGTIRTNVTATVDWIYGTSVLNGGTAYHNIWNAYNRVDVATKVADTTASWAILGSVGPLHYITSNRVNFVSGLAEDSIHASVSYGCSGGSAAFNLGVGLDTTTAFTLAAWASSVNTSPVATGGLPPQLGAHYAQAMEWATGGTLNGDGGGGGLIFGGLHFEMRM